MGQGALAQVLVPDETALLVIDMQNAFCSPEGGLASAGRDISSQRSTIPYVQRLVEAARGASVPVIWSLQEHLGEDDRTSLAKRIPSHREKYGVSSSASWCVRNTWDAQIVDELEAAVHRDDHIIRKHRMSCFYSTRLDSLLRIRGIRTLIVAGVATYVCVESTIRDAYFRDLDVVLVADAVGASDPDLHDATLRKVDLYFGLVSATEDVEAALSAIGDRVVSTTAVRR